MINFEQLGLRQEILNAITDLGYQVPMPVQEKVIPYILDTPNDLVALAQTGTGKTAAFGLPLLQQIDPSVKQTQLLILSPTRELCLQIAADIERYTQYLKDIRTVPVYGGENIVNQLRKLDLTPQVIVATPGRLIDLMKRDKVHLNTVRYLVLDEADEMLTMGFQEELETILQAVPADRRTFLFSATMPVSIVAIAKKYMKEYFEISVGQRNAGADNVEHLFYVVQPSQRYLALKRVVDHNPDIYGIVFCRTRQETKDVADKLMRDGYNADALHGDLSQAQRDTVMNKFRIRNLQLLVATDVAARGLDVSDLTHVINYNLPTDVEIYTHRSGRTGRANKTGISIAIISPKERSRIREIEKSMGKSFVQQNIPTGIDICRQQLYTIIDKLEHVEVDASQIDTFIPSIMQKLDYMDKEEVIRRFVSLEFNRFLDYYKDAQDLNLSEKENKRKTVNDKQRGQRVRLKLNIGAKQNASPRSILQLINEIMQDGSIHVGDIEITNKFTFFDVYHDQAPLLLAAFNHAGNPNMLLSEVKDGVKRAKEQKGASPYSGRKKDGRRSFNGAKRHSKSR